MDQTWFKLQNGSDVRGVALEGVEGEAVNLTPEIVRPIGYAFAQWLAEKKGKPVSELKIAVGHDSRLSAEMVKTAVFQGVEKAGCSEIADSGLSSTPAMFMATVFDNHAYDGSIMLTASHLPFNRNGLKFFTRDGGLEKADIKAILTTATETGTFDEVELSKVRKIELMDDYAASLVSNIRKGAGQGDTPLAGLKIVVDAGNGAGGYFVDKVLKPLGADTTGSQFLDPDGSFPNHIPNPEEPEAMDAIISAVENNKADLGIIFDTDVDRAGAVDKNGKPINRNRFIALMSTIVLEEHPGTVIVTDSVTSTGLKYWIEEKLGGVHHRFKRGYKNVINESIRLNGEDRESWLAMETSGHGALKENYFLDDGAYQIAKILIKTAQLHGEGKGGVDTLVDGLPEPAEAKEYRAKITTEDFGPYGDDVLKAFEQFVADEPGWNATPNNFEGVHVTVDASAGNGWALLRKSLHDPVLPLNIESEEAGGVAKIAARMQAFLSQFDSLDVPEMV
ncbi:phosphohexomutase domain-containing protein [Tichowtungia aerotolerans]|uniref:Phosphomannomutase/phosphoglucomutase n=1 Tax=Tichowtungia aerotolerans TaxID=2697043 RepID=A0A6P1M1E9_9BACT|nr:phosphomannomutase/phosphoglucomutase [Tichowtungia aerotolerans]QHI68410.1 phosphomannomutase/phosphoglucomutase [Tichowtungia aerotolerans]